MSDINPNRNEVLKKVRVSINRYKNSHGNEWLEYFFNNFHGNLPGGFRRDGLAYDVIDTDESASELARRKTYREFYSSIDTIITDVGLNLKETEEMVQNMVRYGEKEKRMNSVLLKIYVNLRLMGYNHHDICS